jgi:hypothetical protein
LPCGSSERQGGWRCLWVEIDNAVERIHFIGHQMILLRSKSIVIEEPKREAQKQWDEVFHTASFEEKQHKVEYCHSKGGNNCRSITIQHTANLPLGAKFCMLPLLF